jgi:MSHA pilin protein MshA
MLFFLGGNEECFWDGKGNNVSAESDPTACIYGNRPTTHPDARHHAPSINLYPGENLMKSMKSAAQAGFTLIELIVVIVILGILAATALPKFVNFGGDARLASMNAAKGAMMTTASMVKGRWVVEGGRNTTTAVEGTNVTYVVGNGYPVANADFLTAAGLNATDYVTVAAPGGGTTAPTVPTGSIAVVPAGIAGTTTAATCFALYTPPAANTTGAPTVTAATVSTNC